MIGRGRVVSKMNIFFDARWTKFDVHDGISRYGANLLAALAKQHPVTMIIYDQRQLNLLPKNITHVVLNNPLSFAEFGIARKLNQLGAELVFSPMQIMGTRGRKYKLIFTLHDVIYYHYKTPPHTLPAPIQLLWWLFHSARWPQHMVLNKADFVATVSKTSKQQIEQMRLTDREVVVVYNAPSLRPITPSDTPSKHLIFMGSFMKYKNVELLMRSMALLPDYKLHLASHISDQRKAQLTRLAANPQQIIFHNGISDDQYNQLLTNCMALVSASRAEGFGLPLLEAMVQGVPVACSDIPIFHEVAGDAGTYFDPNSSESFAHAIHTLANPMHRKVLTAKSKTQAAQFSWDKSAAELL